MIGQKFTFIDSCWNDDRREAIFRYQITTDEKVFDLEEKLIFPESILKSLETERLLCALHLSLGISYYKSFLPPLIEHPYKMTAIEADFWNSIYKNGLGEFLFKNQQSFEKLAKFKEQDGSEVMLETISEWNNTALLGVGGGKDSIVAGELLKEVGVDLQGFVLATGDSTGQSKAVADVMEIDLKIVKRTIDSQIFEINQIEGSFNGHIPISLIFALVGAILAVNNNVRSVVVANESSSSIPQTLWGEQNINHQWSKSIEFERLFQDYLRAYVSSELRYFSAIRPLSSVAVAKIFAQYPKYFEVFTSDNSLLKIRPEDRPHPRWSPDSTKSLSSFILLSPWMKNEDLIRAFGSNYLDDSNLEAMCGSLLGENSQVVLDCVGTPDELKASISELIRQNRFLNSKLINYTKDKQLIDHPDAISDFMKLDNHAMPEQISSKLIPVMEQKL